MKKKDFSEISEHYNEMLNNYVLATVLNLPVRFSNLEQSVIEDVLYVDKSDIKNDGTLCVDGGFCCEEDLINDFWIDINDMLSNEMPNKIDKEGIYCLTILFETDKDEDRRTSYSIVSVKVLSFLTFDEYSETDNLDSPFD